MRNYKKTYPTDKFFLKVAGRKISAPLFYALHGNKIRVFRTYRVFNYLSAMRHTEENTQMACVKWFAYAYPKLSPLLHHSPNGGRRNAREGARFKAMGTRKGFPDLALFFPSIPFHGLFVEMKTAHGRQQPSQKQWQQLAEWAGYKYVVCRSFDDFRTEIVKYLHENTIFN